MINDGYFGPNAFKKANQEKKLVGFKKNIFEEFEELKTKNKARMQVNNSFDSLFNDPEYLNKTIKIVPYIEKLYGEIANLSAHVKTLPPTHDCPLMWCVLRVIIAYDNMLKNSK